jgi:hypothetical protein
MGEEGNGEESEGGRKSGTHLKPAEVDDVAAKAGKSVRREEVREKKEKNKDGLT